MSCSSPARELVTFWLAGTLSPDEARLVSQHLDTCADCRAAVADGRIVIEGLRELHLRPDEIVAAVAGDLHSPHLLVCGRCRDEVSLLRTVNSDLAKASQPSSKRRWRPIGVAALVAAAALLAIWVVPRRTLDEQASRGGNQPAVVDLLPAAVAADGAPTFSWTPLGTAKRYRVEAFSEDGHSLWIREVESPPARWPENVPRASGVYRWRVEALSGGVVVARSRLSELGGAR